MLPPLVSVQEFAQRLPGGVGGDDLFRAEAALIDASTLVRAEAGTTWTTAAGVVDSDVPDVVLSVVMAAARRSFVNPDAVRNEAVDGYSVTYSSASPDVYLTKAEKSLIRRCVGRTGLWTLRTTRTDSMLSDLPAVYSDITGGGTSPEELDPFGEGWP